MSTGLRHPLLHPVPTLGLWLPANYYQASGLFPLELATSGQLSLHTLILASGLHRFSLGLRSPVQSLDFRTPALGISHLTSVLPSGLHEL